jgi:hypothetical protein
MSASAAATHLSKLTQVGIVLNLLLQLLTAPDGELPPLHLLFIPPSVLLRDASRTVEKYSPLQTDMPTSAVLCCVDGRPAVHAIHVTCIAWAFAHPYIAIHKLDV